MKDRIPIEHLGSNIDYLASLCVTWDQRIGLMNLFGPRIERLFEECRIADSPDALAAVRAYVSLAGWKTGELELVNSSAVPTLLHRCEKLLQGLERGAPNAIVDGII